MHFCLYLQYNAITPFNDAINNHLETLLEQERSTDSPNQSAIDKLKTLKKKYEQQRMFIYSKATIQFWLEHFWLFFSAGTELEQLETRMFTLEHNGASLRKIFEQIKKSRNNYQYRETQISSKNLLKL